MGAALPIRSAMQRSDAQEYEGKGAPTKSHSGPEKRRQQRNASTARPSGSTVLSREDITAAIAWRLEGIQAVELDEIANLVLPFSEGFSASRPEVASLLDDMRRPGDRRSAWSLACAVLARDAERGGDGNLFWAAGIEVVKSLQQGRRGSHHNRQSAPAPDALDALIAQYLGNHAGAGADGVFDHFKGVAGSHHEVLIEFDAEKDELVCELGPDGALTNVGRCEFARRARRLR